VKGYVIAALVMLVFSMAYFQKLRFDQALQEPLRIQVQKVLEEEGVQGAAVTMKWMDAEIEGRVVSLDRRRAVGKMVDNLSGVRLLGAGNHLHAEGWVKLDRRGEEVLVSGQLPSAGVLAFPEGLGQLVFSRENGWNESEHVVTPEAVSDWDEFLQEYFGEIGDRAVELREGGLILSGATTLGLRSDATSEASGVVGQKNVKDHLTLFASVYHLPGYVPQSKLGAKDRERLEKVLDNSAVFFKTGQSEVSAEEMVKISALAKAILAFGPEEQYVIGVIAERDAGSEEGWDLWADRVAGVMRLLIGYGVRYEQFEVIEFSPLRKGGRDNGVEILLK
jgi:hypothetical protein